MLTNVVLLLLTFHSAAPATTEPSSASDTDHNQPKASSRASREAPQTLPPAHRPRSVSPVGTSGIVLGAAGLGLAVTGIIRMVEPETRTIAPHNDELILIINTGRQGRALLGAGLGVAAVGAAMLVVDLTVLRKRRERRFTAAPVLGSSAAGMRLRVRF